MIAELTQNLLDLVKATEDTPFGNNNVRVSLAMGGKDKDPLLTKVPKPAAWIVYTGDSNAATTSRPLCAQQLVHTFAVQIIMEYTNDADLLANKLPVLDKVRRAVHAVTGFNGNIWNYDGQQLSELSDRLIYEQRYTINATST